jgi:8-oxo-dGTP diphosphatase
VLERDVTRLQHAVVRLFRAFDRERDGVRERLGEGWQRWCRDALPAASESGGAYCAAMVVRIPISVAALVRDGRVLLVHRHRSRRWYPDCWDLVGGHVESGEPPHQAVRRECLEELGVRIHDPQPMPMAVHDPTLDVRAFLVTRWDGEPVNAAPEEHDDLRWFQPSDLADVKLAHPASLSSILSAMYVASDERSSAVPRTNSGSADRCCPEWPLWSDP